MAYPIPQDFYPRKGRLECARHGPATKSQPLHPVKMTFPFQLAGMDFGDLFSVIVCYFTKFAGAQVHAGSPCQSVLPTEAIATLD